MSAFDDLDLKLSRSEAWVFIGLCFGGAAVCAVVALVLLWPSFFPDASAIDPTQVEAEATPAGS